jgi:hypothetical protein
MRKVVFLLFLTMTMLSGFSQVVNLYYDCNYRGRSQTLGPGRYNLDQVNFGSGQLSSLRIGQGLKAVLYDDPTPGQGQKIRLTSDISCLGRDWNDRARSILIEYDNTNDNGGYPTQQPQQPPVYPSYGSGAQVIIFEDCGLRGNNVNLSPGRYDSHAMGLRNDVISSIRIPSGYSITVFKEGGFRGESMTFYSNVYCLDGRMNDQISSIIVNGPGGNNYPPSNNNNQDISSQKVIIYDLCNYGGQSVPLNTGRYNYNSMGLPNDRISAIRIPRGYSVTAYSSGDFRGPSVTFTYDISCLNGNWNNQISSLIVQGPGGSNNNNNGSYQPPYTPPSNNGFNGATVYVASWFRGEHGVYGEGRFDLRNSPLKTNISSISIQPGYRVTVYEEFGFRGRSQTFTSSVVNLQGYGWNDNIRSFEVRRSY